MKYLLRVNDEFVVFFFCVLLQSTHWLCMLICWPVLIFFNHSVKHDMASNTLQSMVSTQNVYHDDLKRDSCNADIYLLFCKSGEIQVDNQCLKFCLRHSRLYHIFDRHTFRNSRRQCYYFRWNNILLEKRYFSQDGIQSGLMME